MRSTVMWRGLPFVCNASKSDFTEWKHICGSSLENYTSNNMRQHYTTRVQTETIRVQYDTTRV